MNNENEKSEHGGWVFLSHSHRDIDEVRKVRNKFEELGFEPLMFYLKCPSDKDEIEELIKREIEERDWFVYLDSPNARNSTWVKTEREYIESLKDKNVFTIDLNADISTQLDLIRHITDQMKVFISCSHRDKALCDRIRAKLLAKDMRVFDEEDISVGANYLETISVNIKEACHSGFVVVLITENSCNSSFVIDEIDYTTRNNGKIIPVYVGDVTVSNELIYRLGEIQGIHISQEPTEEELDFLIEQMMSQVEYRQD